MLAAEHRLRRSVDFRATTRSGIRAARGTMVVYLRDSECRSGCSESFKAGVVVSKAVGNAVIRNRVKRRFRELLRARADRLGTGMTVVLRAKPAAARASFTRLGRDLDRCLSTLLDSSVPGEGRAS